MQPKTYFPKIKIALIQVRSLKDLFCLTLFHRHNRIHYILRLGQGFNCLQYDICYNKRIKKTKRTRPLQKQTSLQTRLYQLCAPTTTVYDAKEVFTLNFEPFKRNAVSIFSVGGSNGDFHLRIINFRGRVDTCFVPFSQPGRLLTLHLVT